MATTIISDGRIRRRTRKMLLTRARAFAKALGANPRHSAIEIEVLALGKSIAYVEFSPARAQTVFNLLQEKQAEREQRAHDIRVLYKWRRVGRDTWTCTKPDGTVYTQYLYEPRCTCPDWPRMNSVGGKCKHFICAEWAESNYQRDVAQVRKAAA